MEWIKNILINYWPQILAIVIFIASFILQLIKKKPVEILPTIMEMIYKLVPDAIKSYEKIYGSGHGDDKKKSVINFVMNSIMRIYSLNDAQLDSYRREVSAYIEKVLSTPQKK